MRWWLSLRLAPYAEHGFAQCGSWSTRLPASRPRVSRAWCGAVPQWYGQRCSEGLQPVHNTYGTIDSGRELFGDSTLLPGGGTAADGFAALAAEDTNADGRVDALDARFADLRVWRDLNQNGISEAGELSTLAAAGIVAIHTAKTGHAAVLADGNQIADKGTFVRSDGTAGELVEVTGDLADIDLAENPFYSDFTDAVPLTAEAQALPPMQGAGAVRDLREAA